MNINFDTVNEKLLFADILVEAEKKIKKYGKSEKNERMLKMIDEIVGEIWSSHGLSFYIGKKP